MRRFAFANYICPDTNHLVKSPHHGQPDSHLPVVRRSGESRRRLLLHHLPQLADYDRHADGRDVRAERAHLHGPQWRAAVPVQPRHLLYGGVRGPGRAGSLLGPPHGRRRPRSRVRLADRPLRHVVADRAEVAPEADERPRPRRARDEGAAADEEARHRYLGGGVRRAPIANLSLACSQ